MGYYKHASGRVQMRASNGRFRKNKLSDFVNNANEQLTVYICNICQREFVPLTHSGICCGVDDKTPKVIVLTKEQQEIVDKIDSIKKKQFINRKDLSDIQELEYQLRKLKK